MKLSTEKRGELARAAWRDASSAVQLLTRPRKDSCLVLVTSSLMHRYANALTPALRAASVDHEVLDLSNVKRQFGLSMAQMRSLSTSWGCVVSFDYARWNTHSPEIRLPHGVRPRLDWSHRRDLVLDRRGRPRYRLIGLPSQSSVDQMAAIVPELGSSEVFVVGDLLADAFLAGLAAPNPERMGVFSGWREGSLVPSLGLACSSTIRDVMRARGASSAVMTLHPRLQENPGWSELHRSLMAVNGLELLEHGGWETAFADCGSFLGDAHTSLIDVLAMTSRPIAIASGGAVETVDLPSAPCDWTVGTAPAISAQAIKQMVGS